ncbi:cytochrome P450 [Biscogniauxia mediterranea]|nr:cytochrome P450 [Biscogniauxia mediterranea]
MTLGMVVGASRSLSLPLCLGLAVLGIVLYFMLYSKAAGLDHIPGPLLARYTNLHAWTNAQRNWGSNVCYLRALHEKYGDVVRVAPRRVSVSNPDAIPHIYSVKAALDKADLMGAARPLGTSPNNLFSVRDNKVHSQMRRAIANAYAVSTIIHYEPRIDDTLTALFRILESVDSETNLGRWIHYYIYDVAGNMTYSQPLGYLENRCDAMHLAKQTKSLHRYVNLTMPMPILDTILRIPLRFFKVNRQYIFHQLSEKKVMERLDENKATEAKSDILDHYIASREKYPDQMTTDQIIAHCEVNVIGGVGTSATSTRNILQYLVDTPSAQDRLYSELKAANVSWPTTWRETQALPYLEGLVREGIRLRASDGFNPIGRVVGADGLVLPGGVALPPGTVVGVKPSVASVQARTFGARPYEFRPGRWLRAEGEDPAAYDERRARMERGDMSFGAGTRGCIGRGIALMQIYKLVATLVCRYKLLPAEKVHAPEDRYDFFCVLQPRQGN